MSSYSKFDRHECMGDDTRREILSIIAESDFRNWNLTNQLYGLFDGYLYDELLINAEVLPKALYRRIIKVWAIVSKYPKTARFDGDSYKTYDEADVEALEYYEGMGVAEGKEYLATI
jgi:hypothetical protein